MYALVELKEKKIGQKKRTEVESERTFLVHSNFSNGVSVRSYFQTFLFQSGDLIYSGYDFIANGDPLFLNFCFNCQFVSTAFVGQAFVTLRYRASGSREKNELERL